MDRKDSLQRRDRHHDRRPDPVLVTGIVLSLVLGVLAYFLTNQQFTLGFVVGLLGLILSIQIEQISRLDARASHSDRHSSLMASLEKVSWLLPLVSEIAESAGRVVSDDDLRQLAPIAREKLETCNASLQSLRMGQYRVPAEDVNVLFERTSTATKQILATSVEHVDLSWWRSEVGTNYLSKNREAIERGVEVERIFIYESLSDDLIEVASQHADAGVTVLMVAKSQLRPEYRIDMIIWDESFAYEIELNSDGVEIANRYTVSPSDITRMLQHYSVVRSCAMPVTEAIRHRSQASTKPLGIVGTDVGQS